MDDDMKLTSTSKRKVRKRVVSIPSKEVETDSSFSPGRLKESEISSLPSDSWTWRKYGQKPIKGSPYPRGYYKCSSSKGCPARKQVERSRVDPTTLVVTYSSDHNHSSPPSPPPSRSNHHHNPKPAAAAVSNPVTPDPEPESGRERFAGFEEEFHWFGEMETTSSSAMLDTPLYVAVDVGMSSSDVFMPMREEDESLFADLGELPECTAVFRHHRGMGTEVKIC